MSLKGKTKFTLTELLVVIAIIVILAGLGVTAMMGAGKTVKISQAQNMVAMLYTQIEVYKQEFRMYPDEEGDTHLSNNFGTGILWKLSYTVVGGVQKPTGFGYDHERLSAKPFGDLYDPWGSAANPHFYHYTTSTPNNGETDGSQWVDFATAHDIKIYSTGPDNDKDDDGTPDRWQDAIYKKK